MMISAETGMNQRQYGDGARAKLDQIKENRRIERLEAALALSSEVMLIGDPYEAPETVKAWVPWTSVSGKNVPPRRDGYVTDGNNNTTLDVASPSDDCCVTAAEAGHANIAWADGDVLITNPNWEENRPALIVPEDGVSIRQVGEALGRYFGTNVELAAQAA